MALTGSPALAEHHLNRGCAINMTSRHEDDIECMLGKKDTPRRSSQQTPPLCYSPGLPSLTTLASLNVCEGCFA